jgi:hypothetical protein
MFDSLPSHAQAEEHGKYEDGHYAEQGGPDPSGARRQQKEEQKFIYGDGPYQFTGKFKDREIMYGVGDKEMDDKAELDAELRALAIPNDDIEAQFGEFFDNATYQQIEELNKNIDRAISNPNSDHTQAMLANGYTMDGLKKLSESIKTKMEDVHGRRYNEKSTEVGNDWDWEAEDADSFFDWRKAKPLTGRKLSPQQLRMKFLREAKGKDGGPLDQKAKHRIESMPLNEFMEMYVHIVKGDEEDEDILGDEMAKAAGYEEEVEMEEEAEEKDRGAGATIFDDSSKFASIEDVRKYLIRVGYYTSNKKLRRVLAKTAAELASL